MTMKIIAMHRQRRQLWLYLLALLLTFHVGTSFALPKKTLFVRPNRQQPSSLPQLDTELSNHHVLHQFSQDNNNSDVIAEPTSRNQQQGLLVATVALTLLTLTSAAAKLGLLGEDYTTNNLMILQDGGCTILTGVLGYTFVKINTWAASKEYLDPRDSRKLIHTLSAPLFMLFWPLFSAADGARVFAAIVPTLNALRLYLASIGASSEASLAKAVSRSGDAQEALGGPFIYVVILAASILSFWRDSPIGIVALSSMAVGDGLADLIGRRYGKTNPWPGLDKSVSGTVAFWIGSTLTSVGLLQWMQYWNCLTLDFATDELIFRVAGITLVAAILELVPFADDNYTVPLSAAVLTMLFLQ